MIHRSHRLNGVSPNSESKATLLSARLVVTQTKRSPGTSWKLRYSMAASPSLSLKHPRRPRMILQVSASLRATKRPGSNLKERRSLGGALTLPFREPFTTSRAVVESLSRSTTLCSVSGPLPLSFTRSGVQRVGLRLGSGDSLLNMSACHVCSLFVSLSASLSSDHF